MNQEEIEAFKRRVVERTEELGGGPPAWRVYRAAWVLIFLSFFIIGCSILIAKPAGQCGHPQHQR